MQSDQFLETACLESTAPCDGLMDPLLPGAELAIARLRPLAGRPCHSSSSFGMRCRRRVRRTPAAPARTCVWPPRCSRSTSPPLAPVCSHPQSSTHPSPPQFFPSPPSIDVVVSSPVLSSSLEQSVNWSRLLK